MAGEESEQQESVSEEKPHGCVDAETTSEREKRSQSAAPEEPSLPPTKKVRFNDVNTTHEFPAAPEADELEDEAFATRNERGGSPDCSGYGEDDEEVDELEPVMYGRDEVNKIRWQRKQNAARSHLGKFENEDIGVDVVNSRAAAQAAQEADPEEQIGDGGIPMEPFNMRREMEEGSFDEDGNYVWNKKGKGDHVTDGWLDSVDAGDCFSNFTTEEKRRKAASLSSEVQELQRTNVVETLRELCSILRNMETPAAALRRLKQTTEDHVTPLTSAAQERQKKVMEETLREESLSGSGEPASSGCLQSEANSATAGGKGDGELPGPAAASDGVSSDGSGAPGHNGTKNDPTEHTVGLAESTLPHKAASRGRALKGRYKMTEQAVKDFERITELCDVLMAEGRNVYFMSKPDILEAATSAEENGGADQGTAENEAFEASDAMYWQFRWLNNSNKEVHGPFDSATMQAWVDQKFFSEQTPVEVCQVNEANDPLDGVWRGWQEVNFSGVTEAAAEEGESHEEAAESPDGDPETLGAAEPDSQDSPDDECA